MSASSILKNPKLIISNHFDSLICQVDIFTEERLDEMNSGLVKDKEIENQQTLSKFFQIFMDTDAVEKNLENHQTFSEYFENAMDTDAVEKYFDESMVTKLREISVVPCCDFKATRRNEKPKHMKACDLNESRDELIAALNQIQKETFEHYETIKDELKKENRDTIEEIIARVFEKRFVFILNCENMDSKDLISRKSIHLIELDFYPSTYECQLLG